MLLGLTAASFSGHQVCSFTSPKSHELYIHCNERSNHLSITVPMNVAFLCKRKIFGEATVGSV